MHYTEKKTNKIMTETLSIVENIVKYISAAEILAKMEEEGKNLVRVQIICWFGILLQDVTLFYFVNYKPYVAKKDASLE